LAKKVSKIQQAQLAVVMKDPVLWAKHFLITNNALTKKMGPWEARDYQIEMMRDPSLKKVYRCGRRIGKSETMIVEALHKAFTHKLYRVLFVTPYENQVNLVFMRMKELIGQSPLVKAQLVTFKSSPYTVEFKNGSKILGFTTGAASGSGAASVRGQRADYIFAFTTPVDTTMPRDMQALSVMSAIDNKLATISSKGAKHSYMRLSNEPSSMSFTPDVPIAGREWLEIRCWWEVANDFMGGPMVAFVNVDAATAKATVIMFALYAPEEPQRNLLRELEHLVYTISKE
jgi:hypothetical protein